MAQIDLKYATVKIGGIELVMGEGNLTYSEKRNMEYKLDRGKLDDVRKGDEVPMDVKFDGKWEYIMGSANAFRDLRSESGASSDTDTCRPRAVDIEITFAPPCTGTYTKVTLPDFRWESMDWDLKAGTVSCSGKCNAEQAIFG